MGGEARPTHPRQPFLLEAGGGSLTMGDIAALNTARLTAGDEGIGHPVGRATYPEAKIRPSHALGFVCSSCDQHHLW